MVAILVNQMTQVWGIFAHLADYAPLCSWVRALSLEGTGYVFTIDMSTHCKQSACYQTRSNQFQHFYHRVKNRHYRHSEAGLNWAFVLENRHYCLKKRHSTLESGSEAGVAFGRLWHFFAGALRYLPSACHQANNRQPQRLCHPVKKCHYRHPCKETPLLPLCSWAELGVCAGETPLPSKETPLNS